MTKEKLQYLKNLETKITAVDGVLNGTAGTICLDKRGSSHRVCIGLSEDSLIEEQNLHTDIIEALGKYLFALEKRFEEG